MTTKVQKWGNSLALRIPKIYVKDIRLKRGTVVRLSVVHGRLVMDPAPEPAYSLKRMLKSIKPAQLHGEVKTGRRMGGEIW